LIPFISAYLIWQRRKVFHLPFKPSSAGLILILGALGVHVLSVLLNVYFSSGFSMVFFSFGLFLYLFGWEVTRQLLFPLGFLFFMTPPPMAAEGALALPMKVFATQAGASVLELLGVPVVREGFQLYFPSAMLIIGNPCSGLRSLIALMALGSLFAYFYDARLWKRVLLFAATIPIAVASNIARVIMLSLIASKYGSGAATGFFHDLSGILVFAVALALLAGVREILEWNYLRNAAE
jgi:exosortase